jgi:hypothetical protein
MRLSIIIIAKYYGKEHGAIVFLTFQSHDPSLTTPSSSSFKVIPARIVVHDVSTIDSRLSAPGHPSSQ